MAAKLVPVPHEDKDIISFLLWALRVTDLSGQETPCKAVQAANPVQGPGLNPVHPSERNLVSTRANERWRFH